MPTNPLTAADLAAIEAHYREDAKPSAWTAVEAVADITRLLAAVREARAERDGALAQAAEYRRLVDVAEAHAETALGKLSGAEAERNWARVERDEARALVGRLWESECPTHNTAYGYACDYCGEVPDEHAPDCAWESAREALAAWKGGGDE